MEVRLFRLGGHDYVFRFGLVRKGDESQKSDKTPKCVGSRKFFLSHQIPKNKYGYSRANISKNIGLKRYAAIMDKMPEILNCISTEFTSTNDILNAIAKTVSDKLEITTAHLNLIARIHEEVPLKDTNNKQWKLIAKNWGVASLIKKEEVKNGKNK